MRNGSGSPLTAPCGTVGCTESCTSRDGWEGALQGRKNTQGAIFFVSVQLGAPVIDWVVCRLPDGLRTPFPSLPFCGLGVQEYVVVFKSIMRSYFLCASLYCNVTFIAVIRLAGRFRTCAFNAVMFSMDMSLLKVNVYHSCKGVLE